MRASRRRRGASSLFPRHHHLPAFAPTTPPCILRSNVTDADRPLTIPAALERAARRHGNRPAYSDGRHGDQRTLTWGELHARAAAFAAGLIALGLPTGDRVA